MAKMVYVVDSGQRDHFVRLYETLKRLDEACLRNMSFEEFYVPFGRITNMSTRKGKVEFLSDLVSEAKHVAFESMQMSKSNFFQVSPPQNGILSYFVTCNNIWWSQFISHIDETSWQLLVKFYDM